jgi:hypothetical protein
MFLRSAVGGDQAVRFADSKNHRESVINRDLSLLFCVVQMEESPPRKHTIEVESRFRTRRTICYGLRAVLSLVVFSFVLIGAFEFDTSL